MLVRYQSEVDGLLANRKLDLALADAGWQMQFHQGTPESGWLDTAAHPSDNHQGLRTVVRHRETSQNDVAADTDTSAILRRPGSPAELFEGLGRGAEGPRSGSRRTSVGATEGLWWLALARGDNQ